MGCPPPPLARLDGRHSCSHMRSGARCAAELRQVCHLLAWPFQPSVLGPDLNPWETGGLSPFPAAPQLSQVLPSIPTTCLLWALPGLGLSMPHNGPAGLMVLTTAYKWETEAGVRQDQSHPK